MKPKATGEPSVDGYLAKQAPATRKVLERLRTLVKKLLPGAEERISYQIPSYRLDGVTVIFFAGWKEHYSLYPVNEHVIRAIGEDPSTFVLSKGTIRLRYDAPFPAKLLRALVLEKKKAAAEIASARKVKAASKKAAKKSAPKKSGEKVVRAKNSSQATSRTAPSPPKKTPEKGAVRGSKKTASR